MSSIFGEITFPTQLLLSFALGEAASPALRPYTQDLANAAWASNAVLPPDVYQLAAGVAQGQVDPKQAASWASQQGISGGAFAALVQIANTGPPLGMAFEAWRRGELSQAQFETALTRQAIEPQWFAALEALKQQPLDPAEIAKAIHRGIMKNDGLLIATPSTQPGKVPQVPTSSLDPIVEAEWSGMDSERLRILTGNAGLPPGIVQGLELLNRGAITTDDFSRLVGESNMRNEWADAILALRRRLLTPHEYEEAALRGIIPQAEADAGAALSGMEQADAQLLFEIMGRPLNVHEVTTGLARGGTFGGTYADVPEPYRDAIRRSNIRPEYAELAYANRYSYPSAFVLRSLAQAGEIGDEAAVQAVLEDIGWAPSFAQKVAAAWVGGTGATADPHVTKAQNQLWTAAHKAYIGSEISAATATASLGVAGVAAAAITTVLDVWNEERALVRKSLSAAQIKKAWSEQIPDPALGRPWTEAEAVTRLQDLGYTADDAKILLVE